MREEAERRIGWGDATELIVALLRYMAHPTLGAQWAVLLDAADELDRLRAMVHRYDLFLRTAFDDDPRLRGSLDAEWDIFVRRHPVGADNDASTSADLATDNGRGSDDA